MATLTTSWKSYDSASYTASGGIKVTFYLEAKYSSQSTANNTTTVYTRLRSSISGGSLRGSGYSFTCTYCDKRSGTGVWTFENEVIISSPAKTITHNNDGTKSLSLSANAKNTYWSINKSLSATVDLPKINRLATVTNASDFTDEENPTLEFTNPAGFTVYPYLNFYDNDNNLVHQLIRNSESVTSPYTWNITDEERSALWRATNKQQSYKVSVGVDTYSGTTKLGYNYKQQTMTYINAEPSQTTVFTETKQKVIDVLGTNTAETLIQNVSKVTLVSTPEVKKEATVSKIIFEHNNLSTEDKESPYGIMFNVVNSKFKVTIVDSRGYSIPTEYTKSIIQYIPINIDSFSFKRENPTSSNIKLNAQIRYKQTTFGTTANVPTIQWKLRTDGELNTLTTDDYTIDTENDKITISNLSLGEVLPYTEEKRFYLYVNDLLTEDTENEPVLRGIPTCDMGEHDFQVNGDLFVADTNRTNKVPLNMSGKISKNLFDKNNVNALQGYIVSSNSQIVGSDTGMTFFIKCKPNTTYTISKLASRLNVGYAINKPIVGGKVYSVKDGIANETTELTYTTGYDAKYLVVFYHVSTIMSPSEQEVLDSIQIEESPIATKYEDYFEPALLIRNSDGIFQEILPRKIRLTFNHDYVYTTDLQYDCFKIGKMVFLNIYTIAFSKAIPSLTDFIYGLPKPTEYIVFALHGHMTAQGDGVRCGLDNSTGNIKTHYDAPEHYGSTSGTQYSCILIYETEE